MLTWPVYILLVLATCFVAARLVTKYYRGLFRHDVIQEVLLLLAWAVLVPAGILTLQILSTDRDHAAAVMALSAHYLAIFIAHLTKASLVLLFVSYGQLPEYKLINKSLLPILGVSLVLGLTTLSLQCSFKKDDVGAEGPEQCGFENVAVVQAVINVLLGFILVLYPIKPLYRAWKQPVRQNFAQLVTLLTVAVIGNLVSITRLVVAHHQSARIELVEQSGDGPEEAVELLSRVRVLALSLMLEASIWIVLAAMPDMAGLYLHWRLQNKMPFEGAPALEKPTAGDAAEHQQPAILRPAPSLISLTPSRKQAKARQQRMDQFMWGYDGGPERWGQMQSLHHLPLHSTGRMPKSPLAKLPSTTLPACTHSNAAPSNDA